MALTSKQVRFMEEYLACRNATEAALRAGYSAKTAASIGWENLRKPEIVAAIAEADRQLAERAGHTAEDVVREMDAIAFTRITDICQWGPDGISMMKPSGQLSPYQAAAIESVTYRPGKFGPTISVKMRDKFPALVKMGQSLGVFKDSLEHTGPGGGPIPVQMNGLDLDSLSVEQLRELDATLAKLESITTNAGQGPASAGE